MVTKYRLYLNKAKKRKSDSLMPIYLRLTIQGKIKLVSTGVYIKAEHWNSRRTEIRQSNPDFKPLNLKIKSFVSKALEIEADAINRQVDIDLSDLKSGIKKEIQTDLIELITNYIESINNSHFHRAKKLNNLLIKLKYYYGDSIPLDSFNTVLLKDFVNKMQEIEKLQGTTINRLISALKMVFNDIIDKGLLQEDKSPFIRFKISNSSRTEKTKLSLDQILKINSIDLKIGSALWHTRNEFMFSFYCAGVRFGDLCTLKWNCIQDNYLVYVMAKTESSKPIPRKIKLVNKALEILKLYKHPKAKPNEYIFPELRKVFDTERELKGAISSRNALANKNLKKIAKLSGIDANISFHVSRHSYADFARTQGVSLYNISKALGHTKLETTQVYLKDLDQQYVDEAHENLFD